MLLFMYVSMYLPFILQCGSSHPRPETPVGLGATLIGTARVARGSRLEDPALRMGVIRGAGEVTAVVMRRGRGASWSDKCTVNLVW